MGCPGGGGRGPGGGGGPHRGPPGPIGDPRRHRLGGDRPGAGLGHGDARARPGPTPELADAARALNLLADRIDELRAAERERVADLSHRLRTPLTALRLDAEAAGDPDLVAGVDRLEAAVSDLIHSARRPLRPGLVAESCDLTAVARDRATHWSAAGGRRRPRLDPRRQPDRPARVRLSSGMPRRPSTP